jgi:succinyl-diaminopimelate desuccinylase
VRPYLPYTLSPDAEYPLINIEKGRFAPRFSQAVENTGARRVTALAGGETMNIVPGKARASLAGLSAAEVEQTAAGIAAETGASFTVTNTAEGCEVLCTGVTAHASTPEKGVNAQTALIKLLLTLPLAENETLETLRALSVLFPHGVTDGSPIGFAMKDHSGALTLNFGVMSYENGAFICGADLRCPVCADSLDLAAMFAAAVGKYGFAPAGDTRHTKAHCVPAESPLVQACLAEYERCTGKKGECVAIGGGTYVHEIDGGVAFGVEFPGRDYRIHGADEFADPAELLLTAEMYAGVIRRLCYGGTDEG